MSPNALQEYTIELDYQSYRTSVGTLAKHKDISARLTIDGVETERAAIRHSADKHGHIFDGPLSHNNQRFPYMFQKPVSSATAPDLRVR